MGKSKLNICGGVYPTSSTEIINIKSQHNPLT